MDDNNPKPKRGRPAWVPPPLAQVRGIGARCRTIEQAARAMGISPATLYKQKRYFPEFAEAIKIGEAESEVQIVDTFIAQAVKGSFPHGAFLLERKYGYVKPSESEPPSVAAHRGLSSDLVSVLRESLLGELQHPRPAELIEPPPTPIPATAITVADKRAELLGRNGDSEK